MNEYLLSVAEKIIDASVPRTIAVKYYELKKSLMAKSASIIDKQRSKALDPEHAVLLGKPLDFNSIVSEPFQLSNKISQIKPFSDNHASNETSVLREVNPISNVFKARPNTENERIQGKADKEMAEDNRWLIEQMERLVKENAMLRRIRNM